MDPNADPLALNNSTMPTDTRSIICNGTTWGVKGSESGPLKAMGLLSEQHSTIPGEHG